MDTRIQAMQLAQRPYLLMISTEESTDGQSIYFSRVLEIEGCFGQGQTREEAIEDLKLAMVDFIESLLEDGLQVPEPSKLVKSNDPIDNNGLISTTVSTSSEKTITFASGHGKQLQQKYDQNYLDAYVLSSSN